MNNFFHLTFGHVRMTVNWSIQLTNGQKTLFRSHTRSRENDLQLAYLAHELIEKKSFIGLTLTHVRMPLKMAHSAHKWAKNFLFRPYTRSRENSLYTAVSSHAQNSRTVPPPPCYRNFYIVTV